jgi:hypothetical protein
MEIYQETTNPVKPSSCQSLSIKISISGFSISAETKLWKILGKISDENSSRKMWNREDFLE